MTKPIVQLIGEDSNAFSIIGRVSKALKRAGLHDQADKFMQEAKNASSYNELIGRIIHEYVEVE